MNGRFIGVAGVILCGFIIAVSGFTVLSLNSLPETLDPSGPEVRKMQVLDRSGTPLSMTYRNRWNVYDAVPLHDVPFFLQQAFVLSEDARFYRHRGVDWPARAHALWQNIRALKPVRGASTITEQVVRMIHPRPRTLWSRWIEGFEAEMLEERFNKADILEFYLNQVPYAAKRRGVVQASRYYFGRALNTLSLKEMLALAVLVRAPSRMDPYRNPEIIKKPIERLAARLRRQGILLEPAYRQAREEILQLAEASPPVEASHFVKHVFSTTGKETASSGRRLLTTLDKDLQLAAQEILDQRLTDLSGKKVINGAALIVDHRHNEILAWAVGGSGSKEVPGSHYDAVLTPRQPGSTLKPFLYALALEDGWTAATMIDDSPLSASVGAGLHDYHNYSRTHYGNISLREALGNSLNIPAVKAVQFVTAERFLERLRQLGVKSLKEQPGFYGDGLALGNGAVSLFELVQAYSVLARRGIFKTLTTRQDESRLPEHKRVFSEKVSSLIGDILSDAEARRLEFGSGSLLRFPVQTAVKTGTSSDYRDAWALGFNYRYTVGVWIGNLDNTPMDGVTGSTGPALALRTIFGKLVLNEETRPLYLDPGLIKVEVCRENGLPPEDGCVTRTEWFIPGTAPEPSSNSHFDNDIRIRRPTSGLQLALDPRIPDDREAFEFALTSGDCYERVQWFVDRRMTAQTKEPRYLWPLRRGHHEVQARVWLKNSDIPVDTKGVRFLVK